MNRLAVQTICQPPPNGVEMHHWFWSIADVHSSVVYNSSEKILLLDIYKNLYLSAMEALYENVSMY